MQDMFAKPTISFYSGSSILIEYYDDSGQESNKKYKNHQESTVTINLHLRPRVVMKFMSTIVSKSCNISMISCC